MKIKEKIKHFIRAIVDIIDRIYLHKKILVDNEEFAIRNHICEQCDKRIEGFRLFIYKTDRCSECGCFLYLKNKLENEYCDEGKW